MVTKPAVLVTRPYGQAGALCSALESDGFPAHSEPMLELFAVSAPDAVQQRTIAALDEYQHVIFISGNAVQFGMNWLQAHWSQWPQGPTWYAIGELTAQRLREFNVGDVATGAGMTSESLLATPALLDVAGQRVLIVKGQGGRQRLRDQLRARGAQVDELSCYRRECPKLPPGELFARLEKWNIGLILVSSGEGLGNMLMLLSPEENSKLKAIPLIVPSGRVADLAVQSGFSSVETAANASDAAVLASVQRWWHTR